MSLEDIYDADCHFIKSPVRKILDIIEEKELIEFQFEL
jgi:hypothetical protein